VTYKIPELLKKIEEQELELIGYRAAMKILQSGRKADLYMIPVSVSCEMASKQHLNGPRLIEVSMSAGRSTDGLVRRVIAEGEVITLHVPYQKL